MNILSRYAFISNFNAEKLSKQDASHEGVGSIDFSKCDKNGNGEISIEEILANNEVCSKILDSINGKIAETVKEIAELKVKEFKEGQMAKATEDKIAKFKDKPFVKPEKDKKFDFESAKQKFAKFDIAEMPDFAKDMAKFMKPDKIFNMAA